MVFLALLVLFVNDSEYSRSTGAKPILSLSCIYLVLLLLLLLLPAGLFSSFGKHILKKRRKDK
jgi:hypothetical protein